jgi:hypothetical protein
MITSYAEADQVMQKLLCRRLQVMQKLIKLCRSCYAEDVVHTTCSLGILLIYNSIYCM